MSDTCPYLPGKAECDGTAFMPSLTCASIGFAGGTLQCDGTCRVDTSECTDCAPGSALQTCARVPFAQRVTDFAMATTDTQVGIAYLSEDCSYDGEPASLRFALLDADLSLLASAWFGPWFDTTPTLAATPSGWLFGFSNPNAALNLTKIGLDGKYAGDLGMGGTDPILVQQPAGQPLLLWGSADHPGTLMGMVVDAPGFPFDAATLSTSFSGTPSGVFVGDGFVVAAVSPASEIQVLHLGLDGSVSPGAAIPAPAPSSPRLAYEGTTVRLTYATGQGDTFWQRLATDGTLIGSPVKINGSGNVQGAFPIMAAGERTLVVQAPDTGSGVKQLSLEVLDGTGKPLMPAFDLNEGPCAVSASIAPLGGAAIVAWVGGRACHASDGRLTLARFLPPP
jgi:hypothetical protein